MLRVYHETHRQSKMRQNFRLVVSNTLALCCTLGCAQEQKPADYHASLLENLPFVYKMTVQQGNILTAETVAELKTGMTKRQVNFLLGTPLLSDFFHQDRWDYVYTIRRGHHPMEKRYLTLHFQDEVLVKIAGDVKPNAQPAVTRETPKSTIVTVPDYETQPGALTRGLKALGLEPKQ